MENSYVFALHDELVEFVKKAANVLDMPLDETIEHLLMIGVDVVMDKNFSTVEVSDEMFDKIERRLSPGAKAGISDSFWESEGVDEKQAMADMKKRREADK